MQAAAGLRGYEAEVCQHDPGAAVLSCLFHLGSGQSIDLKSPRTRVDRPDCSIARVQIWTFWVLVVQPTMIYSGKCCGLSIRVAAVVGVGQFCSHMPLRCPALLFWSDLEATQLVQQGFECLAPHLES